MNSGQQTSHGQEPSGASPGVNVPVPPTVSYTAFVDESRALGVRTGMGKLYGYGAVVVPTAWMPTLAYWMDYGRAQHGIAPGEELKWSPKKAAQPSQHALGTPGREPLQRSLLAFARAAGAFSVAVICAAKGRPPTPQELAVLLGWQDGTPVAQALGRLIQTGWLVQTPHGLLRVGPAYEQHLVGAANASNARP
ncbi:hypothetical protein [Streptomyces sp. NPDC000229]|uniref:hypothetical protein n=1 Tax=Streptomyces sp. NPDC000229 TaxID=3154247 RepID=UPI003329A03C